MNNGCRFSFKIHDFPNPGLLARLPEPGMISSCWAGLSYVQSGKCWLLSSYVCQYCNLRNIASCWSLLFIGIIYHWVGLSVVFFFKKTKHQFEKEKGRLYE